MMALAGQFGQGQRRSLNVFRVLTQDPCPLLIKPIPDKAGNAADGFRRLAHQPMMMEDHSKVSDRSRRNLPAVKTWPA